MEILSIILLFRRTILYNYQSQNHVQASKNIKKKLHSPRSASPKSSERSLILFLACRKLHLGSVPLIKVPFKGSPRGVTHQHTSTCSRHCTGCQTPVAGSQRGANVGLLYLSAAFWFFSLNRSH